jgi:hypothetical protein
MRDGLERIIDTSFSREELRTMWRDGAPRMLRAWVDLKCRLLINVNGECIACGVNDITAHTAACPVAVFEREAEAAVLRRLKERAGW